jgi:hypothetical protein
LWLPVSGCGYTGKEERRREEMQNEARVKRIRGQVYLTLAPETREWLKNNTSNASRLIDTLFKISERK